jgi:geranylgeranyl diphosphate synthase type II
LSTPTLAQYLSAVRSEIDAALDAALPRPPDCPAVVANAMRYSVMAGGKRLRPVLCLASAEAVGGTRAIAMPAACALEFIHTYSLVHDDLPAMDDDTMRRGRPTLHVVAGEGMAILAGDGLLTEAFALLAREPRSDSPAVIARKLRVIDVIGSAAGAAGMVGGQAIDLTNVASGAPAAPAPDSRGANLKVSSTGTPLDADGVRVMHAMKTGAMIRAAAAAGAIMGGGSDAAVAAIESAATELGLAFQIVDDILDVEAVSAQLGKTAGKDAATGKATYPALYGVDRSRQMAEECCARATALLRESGLGDSRLVDIGQWIVQRSN